MTDQVVVRRCRLRIRRLDGWSWGPDPRQLVDLALDSVERTLVAALAEVGNTCDGPPEVDVVDPVAITVRADGSLTPAAAGTLVAAIEAARPSGADQPSSPPASDDRSADDAPGRPVAVDPVTVVASIDAMTATLSRWAGSGRCRELIEAWTDAQVVRLLGTLQSMADEPTARPVDVPDAVVRSVVQVTVRDDDVGRANDGDVERLVLLVVAAVVSSLDCRLPSTAAQVAIRREVVERLFGRPSAPDRSTTDTPQAVKATTDHHVTAPGVTRARGATAVVAAIPFLALAQLCRFGYTDAVVAAGEAARLRHGPTGIAAALAGALLPSPRHGWRRSPIELATVLAMAGGLFEPDELEVALDETVGRWPTIGPVLEATIVGAYADGRSRAEPVLVDAVDGGRLVAEPDTLLPIAWVASDDELDRVLAALGRPPRERDERLAAAAARWRTSLAAPRRDASALERHMAVAVTTGLGLLGLDLWPDAADTGELPAERVRSTFAAFECRASVHEDRLVVAVPRGQRWLDLRRVGMLRDWSVPWMPGGRLEIGSW